MRTCILSDFLLFTPHPYPQPLSKDSRFKFNYVLTRPPIIEFHIHSFHSTKANFHGKLFKSLLTLTHQIWFTEFFTRRSTHDKRRFLYDSNHTSTSNTGSHTNVWRTEDWSWTGMETIFSKRPEHVISRDKPPFWPRSRLFTFPLHIICDLSLSHLKPYLLSSAFRAQTLQGGFVLCSLCFLSLLFDIFMSPTDAIGRINYRFSSNDIASARFLLFFSPKRREG